MKNREKGILGALAIIGLAVVLLATASRPRGSECISISFIRFTNIGPANASAAMYFVTNLTSKSFTFVGFKFLVKTNHQWVEEPHANESEIPEGVARLMSGSYDNNGLLPAGGSFHAFLPPSPGTPLKKAFLCFTQQGTRPVKATAPNPSFFRLVCDEAEAGVDGVLQREFESSVPEPAK